MNITFAGFRIMSPQAVRELERRAEERCRAAYERRQAEDQLKVEQRLREADVLRESAERRCREMETECRVSIRRQYEVFDKQWRDREGATRKQVEELQAELEKLTQSLSACTDKGRKLLAVAIDRRTPENESINAFLKARAQGIKLV